MEENTKQRLSRLARNAHLLAGVDYALFMHDKFRNRKINQLFADEHPDYPIPPADLMFEALGHTNDEIYYRTGLQHAQLAAKMLKEYVKHPAPRVCEWGCGPGRIIRHLSEQLNIPEAKFFGFDFNPRSVEWCRQNIAGISFETNQLRPPLTFPDSSFDFVYALSIFTHLDASGWTEWMNELSRITAEGGAVMFTTHGQNYLPKLLPDEQTAFLDGTPVFRTNAPRGKKLFVAYHPGEFVRANLPPTFNVILHMDSAAEFELTQDVWVVTKECASKASGS